ncbi:MAG: winged helix-turn-helix transcriptional regulator [Lachnospiraceae bacterium]|nr:winged helix-turn-helix transcriptional regulator [Lachnospiraceae bacterium]
MGAIVNGFNNYKNLGYADQLGSGVRNLFKYCKYYSGREPEFDEGDIFNIVVPLNEQYEPDSSTTQSTTQTTTQTDEKTTKQVIMELLKEEPKMTQKEISERLGINHNTVRYYMKELRDKGYLQRKGTNRKGYWIVK